MVTPTVLALVSLAVGLYLILVRPTWLSVVMYCLLAASMLSAIVASMGFAIPLALARWELPARPQILFYFLQEKREIDIVVAGKNPLLIALPWSEEEALKLQHLFKHAQDQGDAVTFNPYGKNSYGFREDAPLPPPNKAGE